MAFISSTKPSRDVFRISGGVCSGKVSLKWADEYSLQVVNIIVLTECAADSALMYTVCYRYSPVVFATTQVTGQPFLRNCSHVYG